MKLSLSVFFCLFLSFPVLSRAEQLALVATTGSANGACIAGAARTACTEQRLDIPKAGDLVFPCPSSTACWNPDALPAASFDAVAASTPIDGCNNPATSRGAKLPFPWDSSKDPCGNNWKIVTKSSYAVQVTTGTLKITWSPPTQNTDGSTLTDLAGFWIYSAANGSTLGKLLQVKQPTLTESQLSGYGPGAYQFAMTAYNAKGVESAVTSPISIEIAKTDKIPGQPGNVTITRIEFSSR